MGNRYIPNQWNCRRNNGIGAKSFINKKRLISSVVFCNAWFCFGNLIGKPKISVILSSTLGILLGFLVPIIIFKIIINKLFISKKTIRSNLSDDLSYIYLNFNKYKNQLSKDQ